MLNAVPESTSTLPEELLAAQNRVEQLQRQIAACECRDVGCDMQSYGGRNASCDLGNGCRCSVPVNVCTRCGDCDYGDNAEAAATIARCAAGDDTSHP